MISSNRRYLYLIGPPVQDKESIVHTARVILERALWNVDRNLDLHIEDGPYAYHKCWMMSISEEVASLAATQEALQFWCLSFATDSTYVERQSFSIVVKDSIFF